MGEFLDLVRDNSSVLGRLVTSAVLVAVALPLGGVLGRLVARRGDDAYSRYYLRKGTRYAMVVVLLLALAVVWRRSPGGSGWCSASPPPVSRSRCRR